MLLSRLPFNGDLLFDIGEFYEGTIKESKYGKNAVRLEIAMSSPTEWKIEVLPMSIAPEISLNEAYTGNGFSVLRVKHEDKVPHSIKAIAAQSDKYFSVTGYAKGEKGTIYALTILDVVTSYFDKEEMIFSPEFLVIETTDSTGWTIELSEKR